MDSFWHIEFAPSKVAHTRKLELLYYTILRRSITKADTNAVVKKLKIMLNWICKQKVYCSALLQ